MDAPDTPAALVWMNTAALKGTPAPALLVAPGRAVVNAPLDLLREPPPDLEVVLTRDGELVGYPVRRVALVVVAPERPPGEDVAGEPRGQTRVVATLAFEAVDDPPDGDVLEALVLAYAGEPPKWVKPVLPVLPDAFRGFRPPPVGAGVDVLDLLEVLAVSWPWWCYPVWWKWPK